MRGFALIFAGLMSSTPVDAAAARAQLIYKVDHVTASIQGRKLIVTASGAVNSGGWENPKLHIKEIRIPESAALDIEFLATPPPKDAVVIQALLPVNATLTAPLPPYGTTEVKVEAQSNSVTAPISK